jgi:hypothetical protein
VLQRLFVIGSNHVLHHSHDRPSLGGVSWLAFMRLSRTTHLPVCEPSTRRAYMLTFASRLLRDRYMAMLLICRPYKIGDLNYLAAIGAQFALAFSMVTVLCMRIFDDISTRFDLRGAQVVMKFNSKSQV